MVIKTRVFELADAFGYRSDRQLAQAMQIDPAVINRVKAGTMGVGPAFIRGAVRAFPGKRLDELFSVEDDREQVPA